MKKEYRYITVFSILLLIALPLMAAGPVVIANASVSDASLSQSDIQKIYLGKKSSWSDGSKIIPVTLAEGDTHEAFCNSLVKKSASQFSTFWKQAIFTGKGTPPRSFTTEAELVAYVGSTAGAIGYVSSGTNTGSSKVIQVHE